MTTDSCINKMNFYTQLLHFRYNPVISCRHFCTVTLPFPLFKSNYMRKLVFIFCLCSSGMIQLHAQRNLVAAGGTLTGPGGSMSYTAGQIDFKTEQGTGGIMTEGIQQPYTIKTIAGTLEAGIDLNAVVYPNPTADFVELRVNSHLDDNLNYKLVDLYGRVLAKDKITGPVTRIDMSSLSGGQYYLMINHDEGVIKAFQIIDTK